MLPGQPAPRLYDRVVEVHVFNRRGLEVHSPLDRLRKPMSVETGRIRLSDRSA
jgi:hypothetical protein